MRTKSRTKTKPRTSVARTRSLATRMTRRSKRSARTPKSGLAKVGNRRAASAPPTAEALPVSWTTRTTSATIETASPTNDIACPAQSCLKRTLPKRVFRVLDTPAFQIVGLCSANVNEFPPVLCVGRGVDRGEFRRRSYAAANPARLRFTLICRDGRQETAFKLDRNAQASFAK